MQNWSDFVMKYIYVQHRIMSWMNQRRKETFDQMHPLIQYPLIMEKSYQEIKSRFQFALNCGYRVGNEGNRDFSLVVKALLDTSLPVYLQRVTPGLTEEEFLVFQTMIEQIDREEDEIFEQMSELGSAQGTKWTEFEEDE
jgi:hypothetical protein